MNADKKLEAIQEMLDDPFADRGLTPREKEVAQLAAFYGMTYREIAFELDIAGATARSHLQNVVKKLGISKSELTKLFVEQLKEVVST